MESRTRSVHPKDDAMKTRVCGRSLFVWGLSAALFSLPLAAENAWGGVRTANPQEVQQTRNVTGQVLDENGEPMIGVSVLVKGTQVGAITDFDGNFKLNAPDGAKELQLTYMGYKAQTVKITSGQMVVRMEPDNQLLDEVVVIGYGTIKKRDLTGAITSIKSDDITLTPTSRPMDALQGKVAGLDITKSSGQAGATSTIQLRGTRSLQMDDDGNATGGGPTYIIDGMPGDINTLNPNDIESIEVLKDASSTAVYGSSGANGVIIVTTKQGQTGKPVINFNAYAGFTGWEQLPTMRRGESFIQVRRDAVRATGGNEDLSSLYASQLPMLEAINNNQWVNWADEVLHKGFEQNYSVSVSGGTEKTKAYFSLNFSDEQSLYKGDNYKVYSTRIRVDQEINKWITAGLNIQASYTHQNGRNGILEDALRSIPLGQIYNEDGSINPHPIAGDTSTPSVLADEQPGVYKNRTNSGRIYVNGYIEYKPIKGLSFKTLLSGAYDTSRRGTFHGLNSYNNIRNGGSVENTDATVRNTSGYDYEWQNIITYNTTIADAHDITVTGVSTYNHNQSEEYQMYGENISDNKLLWYGLNSTSVTNRTDLASYEMSKGLGFVARLNYSYLGKYLFSASCRWDGSSRLADGNKWDYFPAVSAGWRISDEKFMDVTKKWLDNLKLRVGWGVSGTTAGIAPYSSYSAIETSTTVIGGNTVPVTQFAQMVTNPNLTWEKSYNTNVGIDASFLNNRIELTLDWYTTKTKDVIMTQTMPNTMGGYNENTMYQMNVNMAETQNRGIEMALTTRNIVTKDFTWTSNITFTRNREKIKKLAEGQDYVFNAKHGDMVWMIGEPIYSYYGYKVKGIWQHSEAETAALFGREPGDIKIDYPSVKQDGQGYYYMDADGNRVDITKENPYTMRPGEDRQVLGHKNPDWTLGFKNTFTYKNFDLSFFIYARWGQMMNYEQMIGIYDPTGVRYTFPTYFSYYDKTIQADQNVLFPAADASMTNFGDYDNSGDMNYVDGSFWKIKNLTLGYTLPKNWCNKIGISNLRVYGTVTNLFVFSPSDYVKDYDPEMDGSLNFPLSRELVFGVNLTF